MKKVQTLISITEDMKRRLKRQAKENGMDVSSYIQHLIILQDKAKENKQMLDKIFDKMDLGTLTQLIQIKGDETNERKN